MFLYVCIHMLVVNPHMCQVYSFGQRKYREDAERRQRDLELATSATSETDSGDTDIWASEAEAYAREQAGVLAGESTVAQAVRVRVG